MKVTKYHCPFCGHKVLDKYRHKKTKYSCRNCHRIFYFQPKRDEEGEIEECDYSWLEEPPEEIKGFKKSSLRVRKSE